MKKIIIMLVMGLAIMLMPQISNAQETTEILAKADSLWESPEDKKLFDETCELMTSFADKNNLKDSIEDFNQWALNVKLLQELIEISNQNKVIDNDTILNYANNAFNWIDRRSRLSDWRKTYIVLTSFESEKESIEKDLQERKVNRLFVPYLKVLKKAFTRNLANFSISFIQNFEAAQPFEYDPTYSLQEIFDHELFYPKNPEKFCRALEGLKVIRWGDEDVITSVNLSGGNALFNVKFQNSDKVWYTYNGDEGRSFSLKWYEQIRKYIGKKVIYCEKGEEQFLYKDYLPYIPVWTLESVELERSQLVVIIRSGEKTKRLEEGAYKLSFLARNDLDFYSKKYRDKMNQRLLSYDYVKEHAVMAPESVKSQLTWIADSYKTSVIQSLREIWVGSSVSLFLSSFPKAKLFKNTVSGGKAVRIYHVNGNEFVFKDGVCTSVTKI